MSAPASKDRIADLMNTMTRALIDLFNPVISTARSPAEARGLRLLLVAVLMNKAVDLIQGAEDDERRTGRRALRALAQDILDCKLRGH